MPTNRRTGNPPLTKETNAGGIHGSRSRGDTRQRDRPWSAVGNETPQERHAQTHDVEKERLTNPKGPEQENESFAQQLAKDTPGQINRDQIEQVRPASEDKTLVDDLSMLTGDELDRLPVIEPGTQLEQGSVYYDLNDRGRGPFKAIGGEIAGGNNRYVAKKDADYDLWNRLVGQDATPTIDRPE